MSGSRRFISNEELDQLVDDGEEDILQYFDMANARRPGRQPRTVAVDLPAYVFDALERESGRSGVPIQDLIETWVEERVALTSA
ncbi:MAG: hypothetical protein LBK59_05735 [Bifidobacteriaceae bacterium]|jgi:hypothetical protein|nr:hypothetical protein [Bifidobacteriaceae bacterium]